MGRAIALVGAAALLAGCWTQVGYGPHHRRHNDAETELTPDNAATLTELWSVAVPGTVSEPIVSQGRVYVTRANNSPSASVGARALNATNGATLWDTQLLPGGDGITSFPVAASLSGGELWSGGAMAFSFGGTVRCGANAARLDADDGTVLFPEMPDDAFSPAVISGGVVVQTTTPFSDGSAGGFCVGGPVTLLVREPSTSAVLWSATLPGEASGPLVPLYSLPSVADGRIYVTNGTTLSAYAVDGCGAETCDPLWSVDLGGTVDRSTPVVTESGDVAVTLTAGQVVVVRGSSGEEQWRALLDVSTPLNPPLQLLAAAGDTVYVATAGTGTGENRLLAYPVDGCDAELCSPTWVGSSGATLTSPPTVAGGVVWLGTAGAVEGYPAAGCGAASCSPIADIPLDGTATAVTVTQGRLYASGPGHVTAFTPST